MIQKNIFYLFYFFIIILLTNCTLLPENNVEKKHFEVNIKARKNTIDFLENNLLIFEYQNQELKDYEFQQLVNGLEKNIKKSLMVLGYFEPKINIKLDNKKNYPEILINVNEGVLFSINSIQVRFTGLNADELKGKDIRDLVRERWAMELGNIFTQNIWTETKNEALKLLQKKRYLNAELINSQAKVDIENQEVNLYLEYDTKASYQIGEIIVNGLKKYNSELVKNISQLEPKGTVYEQSILDNAQKRLINSGYFNYVNLSLKISTEDSKKKNVQAPLIIDIREVVKQKIKIGLGYNTNTNFNTSFNYTNNKFYNSKLENKIQINSKNQIINFNITLFPNKNNWSWYAQSKLEREHLDDDYIDNYLLNFGRNKINKNREYNYYLSYNLSKNNYNDYLDSIIINYNWKIKKFNEIEYPNNGFGLSFENAIGYTLRSQKDIFGKFLINGIKIIELKDKKKYFSRNSRIFLRNQIGFILAKENTEISNSNLFITGGDNTVRGYNYNSIGIIKDNKIDYGRKMLISNLEWQKPFKFLGNDKDWEFTIFTDMATIINNFNEIKRDNIYIGSGFGLRFKTPIGPLQTDLAYGFKSEKIKLHLKFGFIF